MQSSINNLVIRFANVNGTGSASANDLFAKSIFRMGIPMTPKNIFPSNIQGLPTWYEVRIPPPTARLPVPMLSLGLDRFQRVLCLGAHADDIEIGCGGALLRLIAENPAVSVHWAVFSATDARAAEARASHERFLSQAARRQLE
ncbi:MAG: hypothetical protein ACKVU2_01335, partial [Saprospiraceae bacterium]